MLHVIWNGAYCCKQRDSEALTFVSTCCLLSVPTFAGPLRFLIDLMQSLLRLLQSAHGVPPLQPRFILV